MRHPIEPDRSEMEAEAERLIEKMESDCSDATLDQVEEFENRSPEHERCLEQQVLRRNSLPPDWLERSAEARQRSMANEGDRAIPPRRRWVGVVTVAGIVVLAGLIAVAMPRFSERQLLDVERVASTQASSIALPDGSDLLLYAGTRTTERMTHDRRVINLLDGGLSVRVEKDASRPFSIVTADAEVIAEGTQFNVIRRHEGTDVCVREGAVLVTSNAGSMRLRSGDDIRVGRGGEFIPLRPAGESSGFKVTHFTNADLLQITAALNAANCAVQFEVAPEVSWRHISTSLELSRPENWTFVLEREPALRVERRMGLIRVVRRQ